MARKRVALIGCGASGMCFLNALVTKQRTQIEESGECDDNLPYVVCFERASEAGGVWRAVKKEKRHQPHNVPCWYDDVWSNISKEVLELPDYTFEEHFRGKQVPTFLPRRHLMDYFVARTKKNDPHLLDGLEQQLPNPTNGLERLHEIRYGTVVCKVLFDKQAGMFRVGSAPFDPNADKKHVPEPALTEEFDFCVWGAGIRGLPRIPRSLLKILRTGGEPIQEPTDAATESNKRENGATKQSTNDIKDENWFDDSKEVAPFAGTILHAIHAAQPDFVDTAVRGKHILLIGDSCSAEELALHCIKNDVARVTILSRSGFRDCVYMGSWPATKEDPTKPIVDVRIALPFQVLKDGRSINCVRMEWNEKEEVYEIDEEESPFTVREIDTAIFCTGYVSNMNFLSEELSVHAENLYNWYWTAPPDFRMRENDFTPELGDIKPSKQLSFSGNYIPGIYRTLLISNPRMMYIMDTGSEFPLLRIESLAWLCLSYITGEQAIPSAKEMEKGILDCMLEEMNVPYLRWSMDVNYFEEMDELDDEHWSDDYSDPRTIKANTDFYRYYMKIIARDFHDAHYPVDYGTFEDLHERSNKLVDIGLQNLYCRHLLGDSNKEDIPWRTYRDIPDLKPIRSVYTGQPAKPLPGHWMDIDADDPRLIE